MASSTAYNNLQAAVERIVQEQEQMRRDLQERSQADVEAEELRQERSTAEANLLQGNLFAFVCGCYRV